MLLYSTKNRKVYKLGNLKLKKMERLTRKCLDALLKLGEAEYQGVFEHPLNEFRFQSGEIAQRVLNSLPEEIYQQLKTTCYITETLMVKGVRYGFLSSEGKELVVHLKKLEQ